MTRRVLRVGLTGGTGAGKSTAAALLARRGAVVVDADALAREVLAPGTEGLALVARAFGPGVLRPDGALDRAALAAVVFADPVRRAELDALVHPRVRALAAQREAGAPAGSVVVHDVPLLVETGQAGAYDLVVVVDAPVELQVRRLVQGRGLGEGQARARVAAQASREQRLAVADVVLDGAGPPDGLEEQVERLWQRLRDAAPAAPA